MSEFFGREYNYDVWTPSAREAAYFKSITHAGDPAPDFTLATPDERTIMLSGLRGLPVVIEFGSIT